MTRIPAKQTWAIVGSETKGAAMAALIQVRSEEVQPIWVNPAEVAFSMSRKMSLDYLGEDVRFVDLQALSAKDFESRVLDFDVVLFLGVQKDVPERWIQWIKAKKIRAFMDREAARTLGVLGHFEIDLEASEGRQGGLKITQLNKVVMMPNPPSVLRRLLRSLQIPLEVKTKMKAGNRWRSWTEAISQS